MLNVFRTNKSGEIVALSMIKSYKTESLAVQLCGNLIWC